MPQYTARYLRLARHSTGSWMTYTLPEPIAVDGEDHRALFGLAEAVNEYAGSHLPEWDVIAFSPFNPEEEGSGPPLA